MSDAGSPRRPAFSGGKNIALKTPPHRFDATVAFYRDTLGLTEVPMSGDSVVFAFGDMRLWVDRVEAASQAEVWLEVTTDDHEAAASWLAANDVVRCDAIESLPEGFKGFWISSPADVVHLIAAEEEA